MNVYETMCNEQKTTVNAQREHVRKLDASLPNKGISHNLEVGEIYFYT